MIQPTAFQSLQGTDSTKVPQLSAKVQREDTAFTSCGLASAGSQIYVPNLVPSRAGVKISFR